jgi:hypothetical protein
LLLNAKRRTVLAVRCLLVMSFVMGLAATGCYNPKVKSGGFACAASDPQPCPSGFYCVDGLCLDHQGAAGGGGGGGSSGGDMSLAEHGDLAGAAHDLATGVHDLSSVADLSPPADLTMCKGGGSSCSSNSECCNGLCIFICL